MFLPMRMVLSRCSSGGLPATSSTFFSEPPNRDQPPAVTLPRTWTLPSHLHRISTLPEPFPNSNRTGPFTVKVRSKELSPARAAVGETASSAANRPKPRRTCLRLVIIKDSPPSAGPPRDRYVRIDFYVPTAFERASFREP